MATDEQPPLPPLPKPKYGLLKPLPLNDQRDDHNMSAEKYSQEERNRSSSTTAPEKDADKSRKTPQKASSTQHSTAPTNYAPGYQEQEHYQPAQGQSRLGRDIQTGKYVDVPQASRREGLYIIGIPGTGKTGLIENLIIQDIKQGMGVGLLDPHGDLTHAVLSRLPDRRVKDVIYLDITDEDYPFGLNLFTCSNPHRAKAVQIVVDKVMHIFEKLFDLSPATTPRLRQYLRNCTYTLIANPGYTMADMPLLLLDENCRKKLIANVVTSQVQGFWKTYNRMKPSDQLDHADSTLNKLDELLQPLTINIVGQSQSTIDFRKIMDEQKILLVKLDAQLTSVTSLIGSIIVALILNAAYSRSDLDVKKRKQFNLYTDEFQRFATEDFATILVEARKFGLATTIAHQTRFQPGMTDGIRATSLSAKNLIVFKVNSKDADELAGEFDITPQEAWEEELEKESLEVLEPEWIETKEVIDGEEPVQTHKRDLVTHLLRTDHPDPRVMKFVTEYLRPLRFKIENLKRYRLRPGYPYIPENIEDVVGTGYDTLRDWLFAGMVNTQMLWQDIPDALIQPFCIAGRYDIYSRFLAETAIQQNIEMGTGGDGRKYKECRRQFITLGQRLRDEVLKNPSMREADYRAWFARYAPPWISSFEYTFCTASFSSRPVAETEAERSRLDDFCMALRLCQLGLNRQPIYTTDSGHYQPRKRQQIIVHSEKTFAHPRIAITHPQRTYADMC